MSQYTNSIPSLHSQVSFEGFCEAYNDTIVGNVSLELVEESNKMLEGRIHGLFLLGSPVTLFILIRNYTFSCNCLATRILQQPRKSMLGFHQNEY